MAAIRERKGMAPTAGSAARESGPDGQVSEQVALRLISATTDLALVVDQEGVIQRVSVGEGTQASPGWNSLLGRRWADTTSRDSLGKVEALLKEARSGEVTRAREINQQGDGATEVPFRFSAVLLDASERVAVLGRDLRSLSVLQQQMISAQQAMDRQYERLRQAETRYRLLFQVSAESVLIADAGSLKIVDSNPAAVSLVEESAQALLSLHLHELFDQRSWPAIQALAATLDAGGRPAEIQVTLKAQRRQVTVAASLFRQSGSTLLLMRLRAWNGAHPGSETRSSRMLAVLDALPDGFVVIGEDRRVLSANAAFCDLVQQANENQLIGQPLDRWLGRPGVDLNIMLANLREHGSVRNFATIVRGDYGVPQEAVVSAVATTDPRNTYMGFSIRTARLATVPAVGLPIPRSVDQLRELVGRVSLKEIVRESSDLIERLCIEAALKVSGDNRASAAQLLGLSRQGLYSKLRRHGLGDLDPTDVG
jgi:transcriptional regulator PpsR